LLDYGEIGEEIGWIGEESGVNNAKRILARAGSFRMRVQFLDPFHPRDFPGRKAIATESRRRIEEALVAALGQPLRPFAYAVESVRYSGAAEHAGE
jgi:1-acyl-sn-glycerol-3-phosphate acyltransferase